VTRLLLALLQAATAAPDSAAPPPRLPASIVVTGGTAGAPVPVRLVGGIPSVRADLLVPRVGGRLQPLGPGRLAMTLPGASVELRDAIPWAVTDRGLLPMPQPPRADSAGFWLPFVFVADLMPRLTTGLRYDGARAELRLERDEALAARGGADERVPTRSRPAVRRTGGEATPVRAAARTATSAPTGRGRLATTRTVVVDAGHGGPDRGMHGPHGCRGGRCVFEADITLAVSRKLARALRERGIRVVMTRTTDTLIALGDRGRIANRAGGDLFMSIHVNAANPGWKSPGAARGFETYFLSEAKTEDERRVATMENESVRFETEVEAERGDDLSFLLKDMAQNEHLRESHEVATLVQDAMRRIHPGPSRGVKQAGFRVLVTAFMPAVLVEIGFGTNASEADWLSSPREQDRLAEALADAAEEYLVRYEKRVAVGAGGR
jgi:N-acetylmuramoyl-L-alanine amidase